MRVKAFSKVLGGDESLTKIQQNIERVLAPILRIVLLDGRLVEDVELAAGTNRVEHKLGRKVRGFLNCGQSNASTLYVSAKDDKHLTLVASGSVTVTLWVF